MAVIRVELVVGRWVRRGGLWRGRRCAWWTIKIAKKRPVSRVANATVTCRAHSLESVLRHRPRPQTFRSFFQTFRSFVPKHNAQHNGSSQVSTNDHLSKPPEFISTHSHQTHTATHTHTTQATPSARARVPTPTPSSPPLSAFFTCVLCPSHITPPILSMHYFSLRSSREALAPAILPWLHVCRQPFNLQVGEGRQVGH